MLAERIRTLESAAREHKREVRHHRAQLRACMDEIAELRALAARLGLQFTHGEEDTHGQFERAQHTR